MDAPTLSILIPCYNAERWIAQAIESALAQTYPHCETIVVDDGSTDGSLEKIARFGDRIRSETGPNRGSNPTRNRLLALSRGDWLQYLDADDYLEPHKIADQVAFLQKNSATDIIFGPSIFEHCYPERPVTRELLPIPKPHDDPWTLLVRWYLPQTGSPLWRKQAIVDVGGWKPDQPCCQEHELYARLLRAGKHFAYCEASGSVYRQWSDRTVCKKDLAETYRRRQEITDAVEVFLEERGWLTAARQNAINQARLECARILWLRDRAWARQLAARVSDREPGFVPQGTAAPPLYRWAYRWLGFAAAERLAALKRQLRKFKKPAANAP